MMENVFTVTPETSYAEVAKLLHKNKVGSVVVCDESGKLVGIISEKDLFRAMFPNYGDYYITPELFTNGESFEDKIDDLHSHPIHKFMLTKVLSVQSHEPIMKAGGIMLAHHIQQLPVIDDEKLVGMISRDDVFSSILKSHLGF